MECVRLYESYRALGALVLEGLRGCSLALLLKRGLVGGLRGCKRQHGL